METDTICHWGKDHGDGMVSISHKDSRRPDSDGWWGGVGWRNQDGSRVPLRVPTREPTDTFRPDWRGPSVPTVSTGTLLFRTLEFPLRTRYSGLEYTSKSVVRMSPTGTEEVQRCINLNRSLPPYVHSPSD